MEEIIVIVIAPSSKNPEEALLKAFSVDMENWAHVGIKKGGGKCDGNYKNLLFMLINQCQSEADIKSKLEQIVNLNKKIIVYTHKNINNNRKPFPCLSINDIFKENIISCIPFSHSDNGDQPIEKFMSSVNSSWDERKKILQQIIDACIKKKTTSDTHSLRSKILTPFVTLHLALQYAEENKDFELMKNECNAACEEITKNDNDKKLREFLQKNELDKKYGDLKTKIDGLCKAIADNKTGELANFKDLYEGHKSGNGLIGDFADMLEKAVDAVEKGNKR